MARLIPLPLTVSCSRKSRLVPVLPFWYRLIQVVLDKIKRVIKWLLLSLLSLFNKKTCYNLKKVEDKCIVSIEVKEEVMCRKPYALYQMVIMLLMILGDL